MLKPWKPSMEVIKAASMAYFNGEDFHNPKEGWCSTCDSRIRKFRYTLIAADKVRQAERAVK